MINRVSRLALAGLLTFAAAGCADGAPSGVASGDSTWTVNGEFSVKPIVVDSIVVAATSGARVYAFRRSDASVKWTRVLQGPFFGRELYFASGLVIVPEFELHALDPATGAVRWTYSGIDGRAGVTDPAISGDTIFVADYGGLAAAIRASDGSVLWSTDLTDVLFRPAVSDDLVIYGTRSWVGGDQVGPLGAGALIALDRYTGVERWRVPMPDSTGFPLSGGLLSGGVAHGGLVIVPTLRGRVFAFSLSTGDTAWTHGFSRPVQEGYEARPRIVGGTVIVPRFDGLVEGLDPVTGAIRFSTRVGLRTTRSAAPCGEYACLQEGRFWALSPDGKIAWADGGGSSGRVYLSDPTVSSEGIAYIGALLGSERRPVLRAFRPALALGPTP